MMQKLKSHVWSIVVLALVLGVCIVGPIVDTSPAKPEFEVVVVETNVPATIITWTKTNNGKTITWGYVQISDRPCLLFPFTK